MGRRKDEHYWNQVTKEVNGMLKCKRCKHMFKGGVSRIKAHVNCERGKGVRPCSINPDTVPNNQEVVDHIVVAGSTNPQGVVNAVNSLQDVDHIDAAGWSNLHIMEEVGHIIAAGWSNPHIMEEVGHIIAAGSSNPQGVDNAVNSLQGSIVPAIMGSNNRGTERPMVLSEELVGYGFEENIKEVWKLLGDDKVSKIGIHGMGGIGKTCLVNHIRDEITSRRGFNFKYVLWVTASQDICNSGLQNVIAERIGVELGKNDEITRAEVLSSELRKKEKYLFILDNVWKYIDLEKVGIPLEGKGNKLILTSRLRHVCRQMDCHIITMQPLAYYPVDVDVNVDDDDDGNVDDDDEDEGWELFLLKLRFHGTPSTIPPKALKIAKSIVNASEGLPLGISVMARTMKGVNDIHCWRHTLNKLQNSRMEEEMEEEVFKILILSYYNLTDDMKICFLCCALFTGTDDYYGGRHGRKELIMNLVEEGLINGMRSLEEIFDEGHTILDKLMDHSLLLGSKDFPLIHGLMLEMVCHNILKDRGRYMVKCNKRLKKILDLQEWTPNLVRVSLVKNDITEIPAEISPNCPNLSTLFFRENKLNYIPDCFFHHMDALTILDLSYNYNLKCLPNSVANLRSLVSLLLICCESLESVPPLRQLQKLSRLVISYTSIEEIPQGLDTLTKLKWLDLSGNDKLKPGFVLPTFGNTQYLDLRSKNVKVKAEDIKGSSMLECFGGCFHDSDNYNDFVRNTFDKDCGPNTYHLLLGIMPYMGTPAMNMGTKRVSLGDCKELPHLLPKDLAELEIEDNKQWRCLSHALSFPRCLKRLSICECHKMEKLLTPGSLEQLQNLEFLGVKHCNSMKEIFSMSDDDDYDSSIITLPKLTTLDLCILPRLKSVCRGILKCGSSEVLDIFLCPSLERHPTVEVC